MKKILKASIFFFMCCCLQHSFSQELFIGNNAEFYLKKDLDFTTSNTVVTVDGSGKFSVEAGNTWGNNQEYVNGAVTAYGNGETKLPTGNATIYAPVLAEHTTDVVAKYFFAVPESGSNGTDVNAVSDKEYWELSGNAVITLLWNAGSDITNLVNSNGGKLSAVAIVGYDSGTWNLVSATQSNTVSGTLTEGTVASDDSNAVNLNDFTQFTFGIDNQVVLGVDDLFVTNGVTILSNPVKNNDNIRFSSEEDMQNLEVVVYDITGKRVANHNNMTTFNRIGSIPTYNMSSGIYFVKFQHQGKQGVKKIIIE